MSQKGLSMRKIEEILRLKYDAGLSHRAIAQSCSVSPSTVSEYVTQAKMAAAADGRGVKVGWWLGIGIGDQGAVISDQ